MEILEKILVPKIYLPVLYICIAVLIYGILKRVIAKVVATKQHQYTPTSYAYKKLQTYKVLFQNVVKYSIVVFTILAILTVYGIDVTSILAGLGIIGVVVGLAFQDIAKDFIAGLSIILENQYAIGDTVTIGGFKGEVIFLGLKSTRVKSYEGNIKIIANRNISEVINHSAANSLAIVDIAVDYGEDVERVEKVLIKLAGELSNTLTKLKGKVEVLGIEKLDDSSVVFRMTATTVAMEHFRIQREMKKAVKLRLDKEKIKIPYPQIEVHNGK